MASELESYWILCPGRFLDVRRWANWSGHVYVCVHV